MTEKQIIKVLTAAGIKESAIEEVSPGSVTITDRFAKKAAKALGWGGYRAGWGSWILEGSFRADPYAGTKAGREHY
jgi:hypothetical protein